MFDIQLLEILLWILVTVKCLWFKIKWQINKCVYFYNFVQTNTYAANLIQTHTYIHRKTKEENTNMLTMEC